MAESGMGQERALKQFISSFRCRVCRRSFDREYVRVAARHEQLWVVSVRCGLCRNQHVFWVALNENAADDAVPTDLSPAEEAVFATLEPVSCDEVLDMHEFLSDFRGDFKSLFGLS